MCKKFKVSPSCGLRWTLVGGSTGQLCQAQRIEIFWWNKIMKVWLKEKKFCWCQIEESTRINEVMPPEASKSSWLLVRAIISSPSNTFLHHGLTLYGKVESLTGIKWWEFQKTTKFVISKIALSNDPEWIRLKYLTKVSTFNRRFIRKYKQIIWFSLFLRGIMDSTDTVFSCALHT